MNKGLFKLIFNRRTGMLAPTWEGAPARGKQSSAARACVLTLSLLFFAQPVLANPTGASVVNGNVSFASNGNTLSITNSPNSIINWQSFSINKDEITRFIQQNGASAVLNRITGQDPSKILGTLQSNGRVFIINPNGIVFGKGATIDVAGLVASTLKMSDADFLAGKYKFGDGSTAGAIKNEGTINTATGGQVYLIAPDIENNGIITSPKGEIVLAAGHSVSLVDPKNPEIVVSLTAPATQAVNVGQLISEGGGIGIYAGLVNQAGIVSANSASVDESGRIYLKGTQSTTLGAYSVTTATNNAGNGGEITATAPEVKVEAQAQVDASGQAGGGKILIGGDVQGKNPDIANAKNTSVADGAVLKADALLSGNGGKVVVWADNTTRFAGHASARGGEQGGNGGFVEVSGKFYLDFRGTVDTRAPLGQRGSLLLDPTNITIGTTADIDGNATNGDDIVAATDLVNAANFPDVNSFITASALTGLLNTTDVALAATNDINVNSALSWSANNLMLSAGNDININAALTLIQSASLNLDATRDINVNAVITASDSSSLTFNTGITGALRMGFNPDGTFKGRVDFPGRTGTGFLTINGNGYTVINSLGEEGSSTGTDLQGINEDVSGFYALGSNIDASASADFAGGFQPLGGVEIGFTGGFDGLGHTISNLTIDRPMEDTVGLFGRAYGIDTPVEIRNVGLVNAKVTGRDYVGSLVGEIGFSFINNSYATGTVSGVTNHIGGLVGFNGGKIGFSYSTSAVSGGDNAFNVGGLAGYTSDAIFSSYATGAVTVGNGAHEVGGLVGFKDGEVITDSYATGNVTAGTDAYNISAFVGRNDYGGLFNSHASGNVVAGDGSYQIGGLAGSSTEDFFNNTISNSYATGSVTGGVGSHSVGGLVGYNEGTIDSSYASGAVSAGDSAHDIGGFVGRNDAGFSGDSTISTSYATGAVSGGTGAYNIGGFAGSNNSGAYGGGIISDSFATGSVFGGANADSLGGFVGFNLGSISTSYASGYVSAGNGAFGLGGFTGSSDGFSINNYWNIETSGLTANSGGGTGLTTAQMMQAANFAGFDFTTVWDIAPGTSYPYQRVLFPNGVQIVSGAIAGYMPAVQQTELSVNGSSYGLSSVGANGFHYVFLDARNAIGAGQQFKLDLINGAQRGTYLGDAAAQNTGLNFNVGELLNISSALNLTGGVYDLNIRNLGTLVGSGTIDLQGQGTLTNFGAIRPGASPGTLSILGNLVLMPGSVLDIELAGTAPGAFDVLNVSGSASVAGILNVLQFGGFVASPGDSFAFLNAGSLSGTFRSVVTPAAFTVALNYGPHSISVAAPLPPLPPIDPALIAPNKIGPISYTPSTDVNVVLASDPPAAINDELYIDSTLDGEDRNARLLCQ